MPPKNSVKTFATQSYYHIYNRGVEKKDIFEAPEDKVLFLSIFDRYLNPNNSETDSNNIPYQKFHKEIELLSYCLMDNHYHLLIWVEDNPKSMTDLMRSVCSTYSSKYNKKYKRVGPLFQGRYKAVRIDSNDQLAYISKYIHLNPGPSSRNYKYSSLMKYLTNENISCIDRLIKTDKILGMFQNDSYSSFVSSQL